MLERLLEILSDQCQRWECEIVEFNGEADHVHLLVSLRPRKAPSAFVCNIKTGTSRLIRKEFAEHLEPIYRMPVFWSRSYCVISLGGAPFSVLRQYIEQQAGAD